MRQFDVIVRRAVERGELPAGLDGSLLLTTLIGLLYVQALLFKHTPTETLPERIVDLVLAGARGSARRER